MSDPLWKVQAEVDVEEILTKPWRIPCDMCGKGRGEECKFSCPGEFDRSRGRDAYGNERGGSNRRGPIGRMAYGASPEFIQKVWREANGNAWMPSENDLRAFLMQLSRETEGGPR